MMDLISKSLFRRSLEDQFSYFAIKDWDDEEEVNIQYGILLGYIRSAEDNRVISEKEYDFLLSAVVKLKNDKLYAPISIEDILKLAS